MHNKTIRQLIGMSSIETDHNTSYLIRKTNELLDKTVPEFEIEDLRILIGQDIALVYLVPKAIEVFSQNLFAEGDYYEGDLLKNVLSIDLSFWKENPKLKEQLQVICLKSFKEIDNFGLPEDIKGELQQLVEGFLSQ